VPYRVRDGLALAAEGGCVPQGLKADPEEAFGGAAEAAPFKAGHSNTGIAIGKESRWPISLRCACGSGRPAVAKAAATVLTQARGWGVSIRSDRH
jgi:hypothetical protein